MKAKPSEIKLTGNDYSKGIKDDRITFLEQRIKDLETQQYAVEEFYKGKIKELEEEKDCLKANVAKLLSANAENMIAYGEEMLKKDKEIESFQKRIETYEAMIKELESDKH